MKLLVIGTGYVGLVSGTCFANLGHEVVCIDNNLAKIEALNQGQVPFYEPGLAEIIKKNQELSRLKFDSNLVTNLETAELVVIAVGTPPRETGEADLSQVFAVAEEIGKHLTSYKVIITKSTVPVGTNEKIKRLISKHYSGEFDVASCPEFLREGNALSDFNNPDRIVIGTETKRAEELLLKLHGSFNCPKITSNLATAEMIKYAANAFLATKISFINEISNVCSAVGANIDEVARGMGTDKRIGPHFLNAGLGYGGSCFPKDVRALNFIAGQNGYHFQLLKSVIEVNNQQRWIFYKKIKDTLKDLEGKKIGIWGLAFKPNTDDLREAIAVEIIKKLLEDGAQVQVYDPEALKNAQKLFGDKVTYCFTAEQALAGIDALVIITEWDEFKRFDLNLLKQKLGNKPIIDGRNIYNPTQMKEAGFSYLSIGR